MSIIPKQGNTHFSLDPLFLFKLGLNLHQYTKKTVHEEQSFLYWRALTDAIGTRIREQKGHIFIAQLSPVA